MLNKLLKYDLKWCYKPLLVFYILAIFFAVIIRVASSLEESLIVLVIDKICYGALIAMIVNILINCFMRNWVRFVRNIYKDESYLTHTLPVSKNNIYLSKVITAIVTLLTSFIVIVLCLAIAMLNKDTWMSLKDSLSYASIYFDSSVFSLIFVMFLTIFFEFLFMMMSGILGVIIGHKQNNLKIVKSIVIGFLIYTLLSFMSLLVLYLIGLINPNIMSLFKDTIVSASALKSMMVVGILVYVIYNIGIYFIGNSLLRCGVDVD